MVLNSDFNTSGQNQVSKKEGIWYLFSSWMDIVNQILWFPLHPSGSKLFSSQDIISENQQGIRIATFHRMNTSKSQITLNLSYSVTSKRHELTNSPDAQTKKSLLLLKTLIFKIILSDSCGIHAGFTHIFTAYRSNPWWSSCSWDSPYVFGRQNQVWAYC